MGYPMSGEADALIVAIGGTLLLFVFYLLTLSAQSPYVNVPIMLFALIGGFIGFWLLALGIHRIIKSAVSEK